MKKLLSKQLATPMLLAAALVFSPVAIDLIPGIDMGSHAVAKSDKGNKGNKSNKGKNKNKGDRGNSGHSNSLNKHAKLEKPKLKGSLNAAHASDQAKANAAPHSRVGLINTYEKTITASSLTDEEASNISDLLTQLDHPDLTNKELHDLQAELASIVNNLENAEVSDETDDATIDTLAQAALQTLRTASNKPLDEEGKMIDAVNSLLNIDEGNIVAERVKDLSNAPAIDETSETEGTEDEPLSES